MDAAYRHEILDLIDYYFTEEFAEVRDRRWQHRLESTAEHYCKLHYSLREVRKKKIPNKDLLLLVMEEQKVPVSQYNSIYQLCRKKLPTFYAWYAGEVLKGRIER